MSKMYVANDSEVFGPYSREVAREVAEVLQAETGRSHWLLWPEDAAAYELELKHAAELEANRGLWRVERQTLGDFAVVTPTRMYVGSPAAIAHYRPHPSGPTLFRTEAAAQKVADKLNAGQDLPISPLYCP